MMADYRVVRDSVRAEALVPKARSPHEVLVNHLVDGQRATLSARGVHRRLGRLFLAASARGLVMRSTQIDDGDQTVWFEDPDP